jgi:hypothetical protein
MTSKPKFLCLAAAFCLALAWLGLSRGNQRPWVEVVGDGVVRTNLPLGVIAAARNAVISRYQNVVYGEDGTSGDPSYQCDGKCWKNTTSAERLRAEVSRGTTQLVDQNGRKLSIEQIAASGSPTLMFITYEGPGGAPQIASELVNQLESRSVCL